MCIRDSNSGNTRKTKFITLSNSYHGETLGALAVGGNAWRRKQFAPLLVDVVEPAPAEDISLEQLDELLEHKALPIEPPPPVTRAPCGCRSRRSTS